MNCKGKSKAIFIFSNVIFITKKIIKLEVVGENELCEIFTTFIEFAVNE